MFELRNYQVQNAQKGVEILRDLGIVYFSMAVRTGKTLTALETARLYGAKNVLFLTKKKAIESIESDYKLLNPSYSLTVINDESMHKVDGAYDLVVHDESHRFGAFPKPGAATKLFKEKFGHLPLILLSGTATPETESQIYHQFWVSQRSPFPEKNFYQWAKTYVNVKQRILPHATVNDYSCCKWSLVEPIIKPYMISFTQEEAGFVVKLNEHFVSVPMPDLTSRLTNLLLKDWFVQGQNSTITAKNAAALQQKIHQLHSGTIILDPIEETEKGESLVLDTTKARLIQDRWPTEKLVIFYQYKAELQAIQAVLGDRITTTLDEFNGSDKSIALQIVSGREGINLSQGDLIVFYNISFSATSYWQARDRLTTKDRLESNVYWLFTEGGIEQKIYKAVMGKKSYTLQHFKRDHGIKSKKAIKA